MTLLMVFCDSVPTTVANALDITGYSWKAVASAEAAKQLAPEDGWMAGLILVDDFERAVAFARSIRDGEGRTTPVLLTISQDDVGHLDVVDDVFDDFLILPAHDHELEARLKHLLWRASGGTRPELVEYGGLVLNLATYQATVNRRPLDMTYMEYELLKHFATNPGQAFTREELLRTVWGYEYYGGARTVDVHVRRLRAKLGEEHAQLIQTLRSVGYIFGRPRSMQS